MSCSLQIKMSLAGGGGGSRGGGRMASLSMRKSKQIEKNIAYSPRKKTWLKTAQFRHIFKQNVCLISQGVLSPRLLYPQQCLV